ncbi:hypothetical protein [Paraburkholderia caledonica]|uniref:hypothetical protein n=1 Tax=Paraburkholderia caledonica TaxID=134536 RepID=UPI0038BB1EB3
MAVNQSVQFCRHATPASHTHSLAKLARAVALSLGAVVRFPPHMGSQLVSVVHQGDPVRIAGVSNGAGDVAAQRITNERTSQQIVDQPPPLGATPMPARTTRRGSRETQR